MGQFNNEINHLVRSVWLMLAILLACAANNVYSQTDQAVLPAEYRLGIGDKIQIDVYDETDLDVTTTLSQSGVISYPFLGDLKVIGLTLKELEQLLINGLKGAYLLDPQVSVTILEYRPFYINGEVRQSGGYQYQPGLTVRKAISLAGGFSDKASHSKITVIREHDPENTARPIALDDPINPGDTVIVGQSFF